MNVASLPRKVIRGLPYLGKEIRAMISDQTPLFIAVPRTVHIWRGAPCNGKCIMCHYSWLKGDAYRSMVSSPFTGEMMAQALKEIHDLCGRGTLVSYMGGEPTASRHVTEWVDLAGRLSLDFRFTTNGYLVTEEMAQRFATAGLFNIGVSLESLDPKINETMRPFPDGTAKTLRCIELLLRERERQKKHISINIKTVLTDINLDSYPDLVRRFGKIDGVMHTPQMFERLEGMPEATYQQLYIKNPDRVQRLTDHLSELKSQGYTIHATDQAMREMVKQCRVIDRAATMHDKNLEMGLSEPACNIGTDNLWLEAGMVKLCPYHAPIGDFTKNPHPTLKEMWHSETTRRVREQTRACRRLCTISCLRRTSLSHKISTFVKIA